MIDLVRFITLGCLIIIIYHILFSGGRRSQVIPAALFAFCCSAYLIVDWNPIQSSFIYIPFLVAALTLPFFFWLFSKSVFDDRFKLSPFYFWLGGIVIVLQLVLFLINQKLTGVSETLIHISRFIQYSLSLLFVIFGIGEAWRNWNADLIQERFKFRRIFILITATLIAMTLLAEIVFFNSSIPPSLELLQKTVLGIISFYFAFKRLGFKPNFFLEKEKAHYNKPDPKIDDALVKDLNDKMEIEHFWKREGLTIRELSNELEEKEYRVRQTINKHLGYRNFNDYLHSYRIAEACKILSDPAENKTTILEIAYAVGYNSIAPFNKAFKEIKGMTPTKFRASRSS